MTEHTVIIESIGGATVLSCQALGIRNIEHPYAPITAESIKKTILDYKYLKEENCGFDLIIIDNRPEPEDFNKVRDRESKQQKKQNNSMRAPKF